MAKYDTVTRYTEDEIRDLLKAMAEECEEMSSFLDVNGVMQARVIRHILLDSFEAVLEARAKYTAEDAAEDRRDH